MKMMEYQVIHNAPNSRFEVEIDGLLAVVDYEEVDNVVNVTHTGVPKELEGRGIAASLNKALLEYAKNEHKRVIPSCSYTYTYITRHPEYQVLLG